MVSIFEPIFRTTKTSGLQSTLALHPSMTPKPPSIFLVQSHSWDDYTPDTLNMAPTSMARQSVLRIYGLLE